METDADLEKVMIIANGTGRNGKPLILIGLSRGNMDELLKGRPIRREEESLAADVVIIGGETEEAILQQLSDAGINIDNVDDRRGSAS
jgi:hypothetical protein